MRSDIQKCCAFIDIYVHALLALRTKNERRVRLCAEGVCFSGYGAYAVLDTHFSRFPKATKKTTTYNNACALFFSLCVRKNLNVTNAPFM